MEKTVLLLIMITLFTLQDKPMFVQITKLSSHLSIGRGNSLYSNIKTEQYLLFYNVPELKGNLGNLSYEGDINLEFILENSKTTYVAGLVPMFRYDMEFLNTDLFIKGGIGFNFINKHDIGNRNIGGHFIFSDMISLGTRLFNTENFSVEVSYLLRHISNAGFFKSNEGFNSQYLVISLII